VAFVYLHEGNDNRLEEFALGLDGIEFEHETNYIRRLNARVVEAKELPYQHRHLQPHQGATVKVTMSNGKVTAIEDDKVFDDNVNNNNNYDEQDDRTEDAFRDEDEGDESEEDESDKDENENKQLVSSQQQETPTTSSQLEQRPTPPETPTTTATEKNHPTPPTKAENIAERVERLEKEMAELKRQFNSNNNNNKSPAK